MKLKFALYYFKRETGVVSRSGQAPFSVFVTGLFRAADVRGGTSTGSCAAHPIVFGVVRMDWVADEVRIALTKEIEHIALPFLRCLADKCHVFHGMLCV